MKLIVYVSLCIYVFCILKLVYGGPRPYFIYDDIVGYGCDNEYGNPSGHAMICLILYYIVIEGILTKKYETVKSSKDILQREQ